MWLFAMAKSFLVKPSSGRRDVSLKQSENETERSLRAKSIVILLRFAFSLPEEGSD